MNPPLTTFHLFPNLPIEIRWMIWYLSLEPRIVEILLRSSGAIYSNAALPTAFRVSKDSRAAVLLYYPLHFALGFQPAATHINFKLDTIYLHRSDEEDFFFSFFRSLTKKEKTDMKYLAVEESFRYADDIQDDGSTTFESLQEGVKLITGLKELGIVEDLQFMFDHWSQIEGKMQLFEAFPYGIMDEEDAKNACFWTIDSVLTQKNHDEFADWKLHCKIRDYFGCRDRQFLRQSSPRTGPVSRRPANPLDLLAEAASLNSYM
jgi:hypothetical protein